MIRTRLTQHDNLHRSGSKKKKRATKSTATDENPSPTGNMNNNSNHSTPKSWDVKHFPLSMSRYQREFKEIALLNSGSFGSVYRAVRELDGCEYAVKKIKFDAKGYSSENIESVIREVQCLAAVNDHPNIVRYYTSWWEPTWWTGSIASSSRQSSETGTMSTRYRKSIENQHNSESANSRYSSSGVGIPASTSSRMKIQKQLLRIETASANDSSPQNQQIWNDMRKRINEATEDWSSSSSSSSSSSFSWSSDSSMNNVESSSSSRGVKIGLLRRPYSLDDGVRSIQDETWESYQSHRLEPRTEVYDDSYITKTASRRKRRSSRKAKKNATKSIPYQYQISLYIQMQLCHPATLQDWIRERNKRIPEAHHEKRIVPALKVFHQICSGLAHIHKFKVIHRDLKPANIFVSSDKEVIKIGDFGLSKQLHDMANKQQQRASSSKPTSPQPQTPKSPPNSDAIVPFGLEIPSTTQALVQCNAVGVNLTAGIGTASYAAPEQVHSKNYGTAVDIFSLGLIFLELVSCFETEHERLHNFQQCRYQRIPKLLEENYPDIAETILACTKPNASDRPTASELMEAVEIQTPRTHKELHKLNGQLIERNREIAEKDEVIKMMRLEIERMKNLLLAPKLIESHVAGDQQVEEIAITVADVVTFDEDAKHGRKN
mmetsp:Transcript_13529/g.27221  ORF Transcript_13529/g.27221 Transcript_13529/m.27221 type:complete len:661 (-) Transcript_13529:755-2737(-)